MRIYSAPLRLLHWINAVFVIAALMSGLAIRSDSAFAAAVARAIAGSGDAWVAMLQWHFAAAWLSLPGAAVYAVYAWSSGHYRQRLALPSFAGLRADLRRLVRRQFERRSGEYGAIARLGYHAIFDLTLLAAASGIAVWKPVRFQELAWLMGGVDGARILHSFASGGLLILLVVHVTLALVRPRALWAMIGGSFHVRPARVTPPPAPIKLPETESGDAL